MVRYISITNRPPQNHNLFELLELVTLRLHHCYASVRYTYYISYIESRWSERNVRLPDTSGASMG